MGIYFGEHDYFGKAEWVHDPEAELSEDSSLPEWLKESWLLTVERSPSSKASARQQSTWPPATRR